MDGTDGTDLVRRSRWKDMKVCVYSNRYEPVVDRTV